MLMSVMTVNSFAREVENVAYKVYVSVDGNDSTADGSQDKPFATIEKAKDFVKTLSKTEGDIVVEIGEGT